MIRTPLYTVTAVLAAAAAAAAQAGTIRGTVFDRDFNGPLAGASVQVLETGQQAETDDQGSYVVADVPPGTYTLIVAKQGYVREVRTNVVVARGQLAEVRVELLGDFTDLEEFVVQDTLQLGTGTEAALLDLRFESPAMIDSISSELMTKANAGDAAEALRLVSGASTQEGKSAVIRGLPDRYVSSQLNGVLLPTSDEDKRAVELDQFPSVVIESLQVSKTFTPDQQGNASGGAVNVVLRGVPEDPLFVNWKVGSSYNDQTTGRGSFLTYDGGGVPTFGKSGSDRRIQEEGENWEGAVGAVNGEPPDNFKWSGSIGGRIDLGDGWRLGGLTNLFYDRTANFVTNARDETRVINKLGQLMTPIAVNGTLTQPPFATALYDITRSTQAVQYGGLTTLGIANDDHAITGAFLFTRAAEDTVTFAEDTQGKEYFFPGHDPDDPQSPGWENLDAAPYNRLQTLAYTERTTDSLQFNGRHRFELWGFGPVRGVELDWTLAKSEAVRNTPDRREFAYLWQPNGLFRGLPPAAEFTLGNLQRTFFRIAERSEELAFNVKLPFEVFNGKKGYVKAGYFSDKVARTFRQETFSNFNDPTTQFFTGPFDGVDWSQNWLFEEHPITAAETDVDYDGTQNLRATYLMLELPLTDDLRLIGGVRWESTELSVRPDWEDLAVWVPSTNPDGSPNVGQVEFPSRPGEPGFDPDEFAAVNPDIRQNDVLPAISAIYEVVDGVTVRGSYAETLARQTFKEISPVFQQEFLGGPVFIGDPSLQIASVRNLDLRIDYVPAEGSLFSVSYFDKVIDNPIEYIEIALPFTFTRPVNFPRGSLSGWEVELRQDFATVWDPLTGLSVGGNSTWIDGKVRVPDDYAARFEQFQGELPALTRDLTDAPDYLWNAFATYDVAATGSSFGVFYTVTGDTLLQGPGPGDVAFTPATYDKRFDNLSVTFRQELGRGVQLSLAAANLTDAAREQVYRSEYLPEDVTRREFRTGRTYSISIGGVIRF